jgi:hypothetical protein
MFGVSEPLAGAKGGAYRREGFSCGMIAAAEITQQR